MKIALPRLWIFDTEKCLQMLAIFLLMASLFLACISPVFFLYVYFCTRWWPLVVMYFIWVVYDRRIGDANTRNWHWFKNFKLWHYMRDYFPIRLVKTVDLSLNRNYMLVVHPHAYAPLSVLPNFVTDANRVNSELFPGINVCVVGHHKLFYWPVLRDLCAGAGLYKSTESTLMKILTKRPSNAAVLYVGGTSEIRYSGQNDVYEIVLRKRTGFIRVALKTGAALVPVFTFGEINAFRKYEFKKIPNLLFFVPEAGKALGANLCIWCGVGDVLLLPKRVPINTVVGAPLHVPKVENPSEDVIDVYRQKYIRALQELFEKYKYEYDTVGGKSQLIIV